MKKQIGRICICIGILVLSCLIITGFLSSRKPRTAQPQRSINNAAELYSEAISTMTGNDISYRIILTKETIVGNEIFTEHSTQNVTLESADGETPHVQVHETLSVGDYTVQADSVFVNGINYFNLDNSLFRTEMGYERYIAQYAPPTPINSSVYESITGYEHEDGYTLEFTKAVGLEAWLWDTSAEFVSSMGTAFVSESGKLTKSTYNASYRQGQAYIRLSVTTEPLDAVTPVIPPNDPSQYTWIDHADAPRMLEIACGYLLQPISITSDYKDSISCQAFGDQRTQSIRIHCVNGSEWTSRINTCVTLSNTSKTGADSVITKSENFSDGVYSICINGGEPEINTEIDSHTMRTLCQDMIVGTLILPKHIQSVTREETENAITLRFTANQDFSERIRREACRILYQDPDLLSNQAQEYTTQTVECFLQIDRSTGLPMGSGFHFIGIYTIDGLPYQLEYRAEQQYELATP